MGKSIWATVFLACAAAACGGDVEGPSAEFVAQCLDVPQTAPQAAQAGRALTYTATASKPPSAEVWAAYCELLSGEETLEYLHTIYRGFDAD